MNEKELLLLISDVKMASAELVFSLDRQRLLLNKLKVLENNLSDKWQMEYGGNKDGK